MTRLLQQALTELQRRPDAEQDAIAQLILDELADDQRWQASFERSQDKLAKMAEKARRSSRQADVRKCVRSRP